MKLGWLYLVSFHRVGVRVVSTGPFDLGDGPNVPGGPTAYTLRVAILAGTVLAGALLYRAGKAAASRAGARPWVGLAVAPAYALPVFLGSHFVTLRFPDAGIIGVKAVAWEALVFPLAFATIVGAAGGLSTVRLERREARLGSWVLGGWRMFVVAVVLAFVGFVVLAGVRPDASGAYMRWIGREGRVGALVATHHLLLLPNQSVWILAPALGSCDSLSGGSSLTTTVCFRTFTLRGGWGELVFGPPRQTHLPFPFVLFALAPVIATVVVSARSTTSRGAAARVADGMASGAVFATLVWLAAIASRISIVDATGQALISAGPESATTGLLALVWGIVGGAIGAALPAVRLQEGEVVPDEELAPAPPRPTSV
jgi:hypothetical protein